MQRVSPGTPARLVAANRMLGLRIAPDTAIPRWHGETMDDSMAIAGLMRCDRRPNVSAETRLE